MVRELEPWFLRATREGFADGAMALKKRALELRAQGKLPETFKDNPPVYHHPHFDYYPEEAYVEVKGKRKHLSPKENTLLCCLASTPNRLWKYRQLMRRIWGVNHDTYGREHLLILMHSLRVKIGGVGSEMITNVPKEGYLLKT